MTIVQPPSWHKGSLGDDAVIEGYKLLYSDFKLMEHHSESIKGYNGFNFIACDTLDGRWGHRNLLLSMRAIQTMPVNIVNASWSNSPNPQSVDLLKILLSEGASISFRDTISLSRAKKIFRRGTLLNGGRDFAFELGGVHNIRSGTLVCPCVHSLNNVDVIRSLNGDYAIVHDYRDGDEILCKKVFPDDRILRPKTPQDVTVMCSKFKKVVTGRIHLGIAAYRCGIPDITVVDYNDKAVGIFEGTHVKVVERL